MNGIEQLIDLLDHGCDGEPRWVVLEAGALEEVGRLARLVAVESRRRGYLPIGVDAFLAASGDALEALRHRSLALVHTCDQRTTPTAAPLVAAAALNQRPHVLVTIERHERGGRPLLVREARARLIAPPPAGARRWIPAPDHARFLAAAERGYQVALSGRHAVGLRMLREAVATLRRRGDTKSAARAGLLLGRVLLERGRAKPAEDAFAEAACAGDRDNSDETFDATVWRALARTDDGRLREAEALLRALILSEPRLGSPRRVWADAVLARCLFWQGRVGEAYTLVAEIGSLTALEPLLAVSSLAVRSRVLAAAGRPFEAGQSARDALRLAAQSSDPLPRAVAEGAHLRILAESGDLDLAAERFASAVSLAGEAHTPLRALRARLVWAAALRRAHRTGEARDQLRRAQRAARSCPALLRRAIEHAGRESDPHTGAVSAPSSAHAVFAVSLLRNLEHVDDDRQAIQDALDRWLREVRGARLDLVSFTGAAPATVLRAGAGLPPTLGPRAFEAGLTIGPERQEGGWQLAAPVRLGTQPLGALACRWPLGRPVLPGAAPMLDLLAAVIATRVHGLLHARAQAALAAAQLPELLGVSSGIAQVRRAVTRAAASPFAVLIEGESGVGKELAARAVHHLSARRDRRFCDLNCAALPDELIESELFGHARGAFTGAVTERPGLFEEAHGGTLFLDEVADLSARAQAKLLRVLQQGEVRRVGESFTRRVDVRIVAAANRAMAQEATAGRFRQDLLYRLDVVRLSIPALRERPEDIPVLVDHFWRSAAERTGTRAALAHATIAALARYPWPGNVRELQNVLAALAVAAPSRGLVRPNLLPAAISGTAAVTSLRLADARRQFDRRFVEAALARAGGSRTRAAVQLGLTRQGLLKLLSRLALPDPAGDDGDRDRGLG